MRLLLWAAGALSCATVAAVATPGCYTAGGGTAPPPDQFYFPVGLAVSPGGHTLYAVNSDFDLQWSGGTLQSYNLDRIRQDAQALIDYNTNSHAGNASSIFGKIKWVSGPPAAPCTGPGLIPGPALGEDCSPPVDASSYYASNLSVGAFATDLQLAQSVAGNRLFFPVRGTATLTWRDVVNDADAGPPCQASGDAGACPCTLDPPPALQITCPGRTFACGDPTDQCEVGADAYSLGNTRNVTMPGEPFGMAFTPDQSGVAITHQTTNNTSLLTTGFSGPPTMPGVPSPSQPTMQFVLSGVPVGGVGIASVPHDPYAVNRCDVPGADWMNCTQPAFLQTNRTTAELDLLRYYSDDGSLVRPYLVRERVYSLTANSLGTDSRGIVIDPTPRYACDAKLGPYPSTADAQKAYNDALVACGQIPARVFFASRSPPSIVVGEIGELSSDGSYDPDALVITGNAPVDFGPAKVYLAPIIDQWGLYELRVFVVCFDSAEIFIYDPQDLATNGSNATPQGFIQTGPGTGPFAMAFDPMPLECVAIGDPGSAAWKAAKGDAAWPWKKDVVCPIVPTPPPYVRPYRFGYVASFTQSFVQLIDLDASTPSAPFTFQQVVFTLGKPTLPKGQTPSKGTSLF